SPKMSTSPSWLRPVATAIRELARAYDVREVAGEKGSRKRSKADLPSVDPMRTAGGVVKARQAGKKGPPG
ncbi:MAG TPA: hypothetical protein VMT36_01485, partial [Candidatus Saccharimonadia bacterium]|nr:hypothetical protein [Candidatus Saccharimonadia bacterium]